MIFLNSYDRLKKQLSLDRTAEIVDKIKKPYKTNAEFFFKMSEKKEIERVELTEDGTVRMYIKDGKEPIRMYPDLNTVWLTAYYKRFIPLITKNLRNMGWIKRIITLLAIKFNFNIFSEWFEYIFSMNQALLNDENYSQPVKEVRRVLKGKLDPNIIDGGTLILEYDSAYRYRFQDIIVELNKDNLNKPINEICRLLDILIERNCWRNTKEIKINKWEDIKRLVKLILFLSPKIKKQIVSILREINIDEVKFSKEDIYWTNLNPTYPFRGMTIQQRRSENIINYGE